MWSFMDSQDVGLEAAIIWRLRNSSLAERLRAENDRDSSGQPKPRTCTLVHLVGERRACVEAFPRGCVERARETMQA